MFWCVLYAFPCMLCVFPVCVVCFHVLHVSVCECVFSVCVLCVSWCVVCFCVPVCAVCVSVCFICFSLCWMCFLMCVECVSLSVFLCVLYVSCLCYVTPRWWTWCTPETCSHGNVQSPLSPRGSAVAPVLGDLRKETCTYSPPGVTVDFYIKWVPNRLFSR